MAGNYFFVVMGNPTTDSICLPSQIRRRTGRLLKNPLCLKTRDNRDWPVHFAKANGEIWLTMGWKELATVFEMKKGFAVVFIYVGNSMFDVTVYHHTTIEQPQPNYPLGSLPARFFVCVVLDERLHETISGLNELPEEFSERFVDRLPNPIILKPGDRSIWTVMWKLVDGKICLYSGWREFTAYVSLGKTDIVLFQYKGGEDFAMKVCKYERGQVIYSENPDDENDDLIEMEQHTLWTAKVSKYILSKTKPLYNPAGVVKQYFAHKPPEHVIVMLPSGEVCKWSFIWSNRDKNEGYLGDGWHEFVVKYRLELNQKVHFFMKDIEGIIHVKVN